MKFKHSVVLAIMALFFITACTNSNINSKLVKRWTLVRVDGFGKDKDKILGINNNYFDLHDDETFEARWYDLEKMTEFKDMKGKWLSTDGDNKIDLFLFYGPNERETMIFTITKVEENEMVMKISEIDHYFKAK